VLKYQNSQAFVKMNLDKRQIEIKIKGDNKRGMLEVIRYHFDHINNSIKNINISKKIPCNCSKNCPERYSYEKLLKAEKSGVRIVQCHESYTDILVSSLLDGYKRREERLKEYEYDVFISYSSNDKDIIETLIANFKNEEITYWIDVEKIKFGDRITQKIEDGLQKSKFVLACLSENLIASGWATAEISAVLNARLSGDSRKTVIPLKLDNCKDDDIPHLLRDIRRVTYSNKDELYEFIKFLKE
jgi:hypothetical protein